MNDWGIPDWRDTTAYGNWQSWTPARWRWEFWRRRQDYREEARRFDEVHDAYWSQVALWKECQTSEAQSSKESLWQELDELQQKFFEKWGWTAPLDPSVTDHPEEDLLNWDHGAVSHVIGSPDHRKIYRARTNLASNEMAIRLNLDRPLAEQLALAKKAAERSQRERHGTLLKRPKHTGKWLTYLRVLDAKADGASLSEIASSLPESYSNRSEQSARTVLRHAQRLQLSF